MVGVGRDLCGSSSPTPLPKQDHLECVAQDRIWVGFEYLQRRRLDNPSGQPVPVLRHSQSKEVLHITILYHIILDLVAMPLELLRIVPNGLKTMHHLIVTCLILMNLDLVCLRKYVSSYCLQCLDLKTCLTRDRRNLLLEVQGADRRNSLEEDHRLIELY